MGDNVEEPKVEEEASSEDEEKSEADSVEEEVLEEGEVFEPEEEPEEERPRRKELEEQYVEERIYTVPLRRALIMPPNKRAPKAMKLIKAFVQKHMKVGEEPVEEGEEEEGGRMIIKNEVNQRIWSRGIEKPPRKVRIRAAKDEEGNVTVFLA
ncbi:MAG: 50S ribosomal protein L31e [Candidatus Bathyarchaeota archaeon]|nr:50S ribosomal protein L31e [Candidatus Bathyarchaeota archaeon]